MRFEKKRNRAGRFRKEERQILIAVLQSFVAVGYRL
jgi:hypothetical protein